MDTEKSKTGSLPTAGKVAIIYAVFIIGLPVVLAFPKHSDSLDLSEVRGSLLYAFWDDRQNGIRKLNISDETTEEFFLLPDDERRRISEFHYIEAENTLVAASCIAGRLREEWEKRDELWYRTFVRTGPEEGFLEGVKFAYRTSVSGVSKCNMRYADRLHMLGVWHEDELDFLDIETGETEKQLFLGKSISYLDRNEDFTELLVSGGGLWTADADGNRRTQLRDEYTGFPYYTEDYEAIVYATSGEVWKMDIETLESAKLCNIEYLGDRVDRMVISPDRKYLAVYVMKKNFFGYTDGVVAIIRIRDGKTAVLFEDSPIEVEQYV